MVPMKRGCIALWAVTLAWVCAGGFVAREQADPRLRLPAAGEDVGLRPAALPEGYVPVTMHEPAARRAMDSDRDGRRTELDRSVWFAGGGRGGSVGAASFDGIGFTPPPAAIMPRKPDSAGADDDVFGGGESLLKDERSGWGWIQDDVSSADRAAAGRREERRASQRVDLFSGGVPGLPNLSPYRDALPQPESILP